MSVVGDFNRWDGRVDAMRPRGSSGIWELFIPELNEGAIYKYEIIGPAGNMLPFEGRSVWVSCRTAAEYRLGGGTVWIRIRRNDGNWIERRRTRKWLDAPICDL